MENLHEKSAKMRGNCTKLVQLWLKSAPKRCETGDVSVILLSVVLLVMNRVSDIIR